MIVVSNGHDHTVYQGRSAIRRNEIGGFCYVSDEKKYHGFVGSVYFDIPARLKGKQKAIALVIAIHQTVNRVQRSKP